MSQPDKQSWSDSEWDLWWGLRNLFEKQNKLVIAFLRGKGQKVGIMNHDELADRVLELAKQHLVQQNKEGKRE